jgi:hypothetical protein
MRIGNRPVNPQQVAAPRGNTVPAALHGVFQQQVRSMDRQLDAISPAAVALAEANGRKTIGN